MNDFKPGLEGVVAVETAPVDVIPQLVDSQARFSMLPELSMIMRMFGTAMSLTNGGVDV